MPFLAYLDETPVAPVEVPNGTTVTCPDCGERMYPRGGDERVPIRHFAHHGQQTEDCSGSPSPGESDRHAFLKGVAASRLATQFPDAKVNVEASIPVPPGGQKEERRADVAAQFRDNDPYWGKGLIVEVQYLNHTKNLLATTQDYLRAGYSVFWARPQNFTANDLAWDTIQAAFENSDEHTSLAYAIHDSGPEDISLRPTPHLAWDDPRPDCSHDWVKESDTHIDHESCPGCGINRLYDRNRGKFLYDPHGILGPVAPDPEHRLGPCPDSDDGQHNWNERIQGTGTWLCSDCRRVLVDFGAETTILAAGYPGDPFSLEADPYTCDHDWSYNHNPDREERSIDCDSCGHYEIVDAEDPRWQYRYP